MSDDKCKSSGCAGVPAWVVTWPGQHPSPMCQRCADRAKGVADAMGFPLAMSRLAEVVP